MQHIPKQSRYVSRPALKLLCKSFCGTGTKKFGDPGLAEGVVAIIGVFIRSRCSSRSHKFS